MKNVLLGFVGAISVMAALMAQGRINPTDPQPTCTLCPGTYIPA